MKISIFVSVCFTALLFLDFAESRLSILTNGKKVHRRKRDWKYPKITINETPKGGAFKRKSVATISSDNKETKIYKLESPSDFFVLESEVIEKEDVGILYQTKPVDFEKTKSFKLLAGAYKADGVTPSEDPIELDIAVNDYNDNSPVFFESSLTGSVFETQISGPFMQLEATDADSNSFENNVIRFYYDGDRPEMPASASPSFSVAKDGSVSVLRRLDHEKDPVIRFWVIAKDGFETGARNSASARVTVNVLDGNDHAPVFTNKQPYFAEVGELLPIGKKVIEIAASDVDKNVNKEVSFRIVGGNDLDKFEIKSYPNSNGPSTGVILLKNSLDYESGHTRFSLKVEAYNAAAENSNDPTYWNSTTVTIEVSDENEPPVFIGTPYTASIKENSDVPEPLITVKAEDYDTGIQDITYSLLNADSWFEISPTTGAITVIQSLDREHELIKKNSQYILKVRAKDKFNAWAVTNVTITVIDVNDNVPKIKPLQLTHCESAKTTKIGNLTIIDEDTRANGPPFTFRSLESDWPVESMSDYEALLMTTLTQFNADDKNEYLIPIQVSDNGDQVATSTVTVSICRCDENGACRDVRVVPGGTNILLIVLVIAAIFILFIIILAVVAYRRRQSADLEKQGLFMDEDDVRENLQAYHDEGGGEEDNDGYDISALQAPPMVNPKRVDEMPYKSAQPQPRPKIPPDTDIADYITDAKDQADNDPTAPPFDSLLVFDYEGQGSDAGSLSSLNSGTTDGSQDYNYLNNWGPRFKKLADMYGGGEDD